MVQEHNIIELRNITKCYVKDVPVMENMSLSIRKGELVTLLGPSGCGKTTILRMIGGFELPTAGQVLLHGKDISTVPPNKRPINTIFQKYALFPFLNIYDNIAFGLKIKKLPKDTIQEKVKRVLEIVDLEGFERRRISTLSGGQQQRVAIARAIVNEPEILLLDEPLGALDYKMRQEMQLELKSMHEELGLTFIYVTHDQEEALTLSDRIVVMADGRIQQEGTPEEIYRKPNNLFVADFIGVSNIFNGFMTGEKKALFCDTEFLCVDDYPAGTKIEAVIRPEDITLSAPEEGQLSGEVIDSIFKGDCHEVTVQCGKNEVVAYSNSKLERGRQIGISVAPEGIHLMPYDTSVNHFPGVVDENGGVRTEDGVVLPGFFSGTPVGSPAEMFFDSSDAQLSDDADAGIARGHIESMFYVGDHYVYVVRSGSDTDYYAEDEWLWNIGDYVSVVVPKDKIQARLIG